eukprot:1181096-Prorocentrum_minimum.AAC.1
MAAQRLEQKGSRLVQHAGRPRGDAGVSFARQESGRLADKVGHGVRYGGRAAHGQDHCLHVVVYSDVEAWRMKIVEDRVGIVQYVLRAADVGVLNNPQFVGDLLHLCQNANPYAQEAKCIQCSASSRMSRFWQMDNPAGCTTVTPS